MWSSNRWPIIIFSLLGFFPQVLCAQASITISGSTCVAAGETDTYTCDPSYTSGWPVQWCVNGGVITGTSNTCQGTSSANSVTITWGSSGGSVNVHVYSSSNPSGSLTVGLYTALSPGNITSNSTQTVNSGTTPAQITASAASGGGCGSIIYNYQWQQSPDGSNWTNISGATGQNLTFSSGATQLTTYYRRQVSGTFAPGYTNSAVVNVIPPLTSGTVTPAVQDIFPEGTPGQLYGTAASGGGCGTYAYQWLISTNNQDFYPISGTSTQSGNPTPVTYAPPTPVQTSYYEYMVTCNGVTQYSNSVVVNVHAHLAPGTITSPVTNIFFGRDPGNLTATQSTGGICNGGYTCQWQYSIDGVNWSNAGTGNLYYDPGDLTTNTFFRYQTICGSETVYTDQIEITVKGQLFSGPITPAQQSIAYAANAAALSVSPSGGDGQYTYVWYWDAGAGGSFAPISDVPSTPNYNPGQLTQTTRYYVQVTDGPQQVNSPVAIVTVGPPPFNYIGAISPAAISINSGGNPGNLTYVPVQLPACSDGIHYQWQSSADNINWSATSGPDAAVYAPGAINATTYYRVTVYCGTQSLGYSNSCMVTVGQIISDLNYIISRSFSKPGIPDKATADGITATTDVQQSTTFFDGLGRPVQTVAKQGSPLGKDLVSMQLYDPFGREITHPLPYVSASNDGNYKPYPLQEQATFNTAQFPGEQSLVGQTTYEASPLDRAVSNYAAGNSWIGAARGVQTDYQVNTVSENVRLWNIDPAPGSLPVSTTTYQDGQLFKTVTTDEQGHQVIDYKDKYGLDVLKKVQIDNAPGSDETGWLATYYVYDGLSNLRFVIPPMAVQQVSASGWTVSQTIADALCFRYEYDARNRMILKKVPGAGEVDMVYDIRDRLVMSQDANLHQSGQWLVTQYDGLNRQVETAMMNYVATPSNLQQSVTTVTAAGGATVTLSTDTLIQSANTSGDIRASRSITLENFSTQDNAVFIGEIVNGNWGSGGSSTNSNAIALSPIPAGVTLLPLTLTYYDDYNWVTGSNTSLSSSFASSVTGDPNLFITGYNASPAYAVAITPHAITRGQVTGMQALVLGTQGQYLSTVNFYDDRGRPIQSQSVNYTGGLDTLTTQYDFSGKPLRTLLAQAKPSNTAQYHRILTKTNYDANFRITSIYKNIDGAPADQVIATMQYNELGQLSMKYLGQDPATLQPLDNLAFDYNIRGWVTGINKNYVKGSTQNYFGMELGYDNPASVSGKNYSTRFYNGNIAGTVWKSAGDQVSRKYDFSYDNANRFTGAAYMDNNNTNGWGAAAMDYSVSMSDYDANGNIKGMNQNGFKIGSPMATIDALTYTYYPNSNQLMQVYDDQNDATSTLGDFHYKNAGKVKGVTVDYTYDGNGNLVTDANKGIDAIAYNYLNLPQKVHLAGKGSIFYTYDAAGNKLAKQTIDDAAGLATTTLYLGGTQYQRRTSLTNTTGGADTLQFIGHEEGRARWAFHKYLNGDSAFGWEYDFVERDHLGDTRVLLSQEKDTAQYVATMEAAFRGTEDALFYGIDESSYSWKDVPGHPTPGTMTSPNDSVAKLNGNGPKVGPSIILKVMAGDQVDLGVQYYYQSTSDNSASALSANDLLNSLASGLATLSAPAEASLGVLSNTSSSPLLAALSSSIGNQTGTGTSKPQAYLNWMLLDNQFNYVGGNNQSAAMQVANAGAQADGSLQSPLCYKGLPISKSGYLYIYVSNATPGWDVFFDNLSVKHYSGALLEENHYYPFGLTMAGISDKAVKSNYAENKYRFQKQELQNKEFSDGSGLEWYEFKYRMDDPQIGRFWQVDPLSDSFPKYSTYAFSGNMVTAHVEMEGLEPVYAVHSDDINSLSGAAHLFFHGANKLAGGIVATAFAPFNMIDRMNAAGNTHNPALKAQFENEAKSYAIQTVVAAGTSMALVTLGDAIAAGSAEGVNPFAGEMAPAAKGELGEGLTKGILQSQFKDAQVLEQVGIKLDGASMRADFVVVQNGQVVSVVESKVDGGVLSNGQKLFFNDKDIGTLTGKNAGAFKGIQVDPSKVQATVYHWDSKTGTFVTQ